MGHKGLFQVHDRLQWHADELQRLHCFELGGLCIPGLHRDRVGRPGLGDLVQQRHIAFCDRAEDFLHIVSAGVCHARHDVAVCALDIHDAHGVRLRRIHCGEILSWELGRVLRVDLIQKAVIAELQFDGGRHNALDIDLCAACLRRVERRLLGRGIGVNHAWGIGERIHAHGGNRATQSVRRVGVVFHAHGQIIESNRAIHPRRLAQHVLGANHRERLAGVHRATLQLGLHIKILDLDCGRQLGGAHLDLGGRVPPRGAQNDIGRIRQIDPQLCGQLLLCVPLVLHQRWVDAGKVGLLRNVQRTPRLHRCAIDAQGSSAQLVHHRWQRSNIKRSIVQWIGGRDARGHTREVLDDRHRYRHCKHRALVHKALALSNSASHPLHADLDGVVAIAQGWVAYCGDHPAACFPHGERDFRPVWLDEAEGALSASNEERGSLACCANRQIGHPALLHEHPRLLHRVVPRRKGGEKHLSDKASIHHVVVLWRYLPREQRGDHIGSRLDALDRQLVGAERVLIAHNNESTPSCLRHVAVLQVERIPPDHKDAGRGHLLSA